MNFTDEEKRILATKLCTPDDVAIVFEAVFREREFEDIWEIMRFHDWLWEQYWNNRRR